MLRQWFGLVLLLAVCLPGCGHPPVPLPTTYPVHGKVIYKDGAPVAGGLVQFQPLAEPSVTTGAAIQANGTYTLITMRDGLRAEGAVSGPNRVIVTPATATNASPQTIDLKKLQPEPTPTIYPTPRNVEQHDNEFNLTVERPSVHGR
jgi:hypothetical protein